MTSDRAKEIISNLWGTAICCGLIAAFGIAYGVLQDNLPILLGGWLLGAASGLASTVAMVASGVKLGVTASRT